MGIERAGESTYAAASVLEASNVVRAFGSRRAVDGITLQLRRGDCLALFGPNGAGKTTLLRMLGGMLRPSSGSVSIGGVRLPADAGVRARVGVISHHTMLYDALTARENIEFSARMYGVRDVQAASAAALVQLDALAYSDVPVRLLSRGMQQRVAVARAVVHRPSILLADEPFTGLDASGAAALSAMLAQLRDAGATIVIVTHNLDEALALCTHAAIMRNGAIVRFDSAPVASPLEYTSLYRELAADAAS